MAAAPPSPALGPVTSPGNGDRVARRRKRHPLRALITLLVAALLFSGGYAAWHWLRDGPVTITPRCIAGTSGNAAAIGVEQAGNAALIGAIGIERGLPARAVTIALATAMQESKIRNLDHGDRDSLGLFQQRPSQGWGSPEELMDPHYATNAFYDMLITIEGYEQMEVTDAAQQVQRSAFPTAYAQHERLARLFASGITGYSPATVTCHLRPVTDEDAAVALHRVRQRLAKDFPSVSASDGEGRLLLDTSGLPGGDQQRHGWAVATWAVLTASETGVSRVTVDNKVWDRSAGDQAHWQDLPADDPAGGDPAGVVGIN